MAKARPDLDSFPTLAFDLQTKQVSVQQSGRRDAASASGLFSEGTSILDANNDRKMFYSFYFTIRIK